MIQKRGEVSDLSRRDVVALSVGAGLDSIIGSSSADELRVIETDVAVKTVPTYLVSES